jgi:hypothetical protein
MKTTLLSLLLACCVFASAQTPTTPNTGLATPQHAALNWDRDVNGNFTMLDNLLKGLSPCASGTPAVIYFDGQFNVCDPHATWTSDGSLHLVNLTGSGTLTASSLITTGTGFTFTFQGQAAPLDPVSGKSRWWVDITTGRWTCRGFGTSCNPSPNGAASGDLAGNYPNPTLAASGVTPGSYGDATHSANLTIDAKGRVTSATNVVISGSGGGGAPLASWAGDGSEGSVIADGTSTVACLGTPVSNTYTLTRDCYFTTLSVNSGVTVKTVSNRILASTSLTNSGTIQNLGNTGGNGGNASGSNSSTGGTNGVNSITLAAGSLSSPLAAIAGRSGATGSTGVGVAGTAGTLGGTGGPVALVSATSNAGVAGGNSGGSGASGGSQAGATGGAGGAGVASVLDKSTARELSLAVFLRDASFSAFQVMGQNGSGGSGAAGAGDLTNTGGGGGGSGGGGGQGGFIVLISPTITLNTGSVINVSAGNGGNGGNGGSPTVGNCGGGGGGAGGDGGTGGIIVRIYSTLTNSGTDTVSGGSGGTPGSHGVGVGTGANGTDGSTGNSGTSGLIYNLQLT